MIKGTSRGELAARTITLKEWGEHVLTAEQWRTLRDHEAFWALVRQGVFSVTQSSKAEVLLGANNYVGRCRIGDLHVDVAPKVGARARALLAHATGTDFKLSVGPTSESELDALIIVLVERFLDALGTYCSTGREWAYRMVAGSGPLQRGRLDMHGTISLRARGDRARVAYQVPEITRSTPKNRILAASLRSIEQISVLQPMPDRILEKSRSLGRLFTDCVDQRLLATSRRDLVAEGDQLARTQTTRRGEDLLSLAVTIIGKASFGDLMESGRNVPLSWFINFQTLFESAVRACLANAVQSGEVTDGKSDSHEIYAGVRGRYTANPDLVWTRPGRTPIVGDVKYKDLVDLQKWPASSDLYQLSAHAGAFGAKECFLVYPGNEFAFKFFGAPRSGKQTWVFLLDPCDLMGGLKKMIERLEEGAGLQNGASMGASREAVSAGLGQ